MDSCVFFISREPGKKVSLRFLDFSFYETALIEYKIKDENLDMLS